MRRGAAGRDVDLPLVDAVAARDTATGAVGVSLINRDMARPVTVALRVEGGGAGGAARWLLLRGGAGTGGEKRELPRTGACALVVTLPPHSASLVSVPTR